MFTQQEPHQCIKISNLLHDVTFQIEYLIYCFTVHQMDVPLLPDNLHFILNVILHKYITSDEKRY
jgi:hypothetical protein